MSRITRKQAENIRKAKIAEYAQINAFQAPKIGLDNGAFGRLKELANTSRNSIKTSVSAQDQHDNDKFVIGRDGKKHRAEIESKVNGGRIDHILEMAQSANTEYKFVVYTLQVCNANTSGKTRACEDVIIPAKLFIEKLVEFGAIKTNKLNGVLRGYSIQHTKKAWYEWINEYPVKYNPDDIYEWWMFDGLE